MSDLYPVSGSKIYIGGTHSTQSTDFTSSDFSGESWTEIDGWSRCGAIGDKVQEITTQLINRGRDIRQKGTANAGTMENVFAVISGDAGQEAIIAAASGSDKNNYAFKIEWVNGDVDYFIGLVLSASKAGGEANAIMVINATIGINSNIVNVPA